MRFAFTSHRSLLIASALLLASPALVGCSGSDVGSGDDNITDVPHTPVERQSIGNCWLYAQATWVESMHLTATGDEFDTSQSYWTYWHWFDQVLGGFSDEISTGGNQWTANDIIQQRGLMIEADFVSEDTTSEMSDRQKTALDTMNRELKDGRLADSSDRENAKLVREVMDEAWKLTPEVKDQLDRVFGEDASKTLSNGASVDGTSILSPDDFKVAYTERQTNPDEATLKETTLSTAIEEWETASYPSSESSRRSLLIRVQKALHDRQPVMVTWDVDFNAMESRDNELKGSFNLTTLADAGGPGRQGGHMTVFEDYQAETEEFGLLKAGETLDPENPDDQAKLEAALLPSTKIVFMRIKNSWGGFRDDRASAPGFPGYHDLYLDYLNGPIKWCPDVEGTKTSSNCTGKSNPLDNVLLPPGY